MTRKRHDIEAKKKEFLSKLTEREQRNAPRQRLMDPWELDVVLDLFWTIVGSDLAYFTKYAERTCAKRGYTIDFERADDLVLQALLKGYGLLKDQYTGIPVNFVFDASKGDLRGWIVLLLGTGAGHDGRAGIIGEYLMRMRRNREVVLVGKDENGEDGEVVLPDTQDNRRSLQQLLNEDLADRFIPLYKKIAVLKPNQRLAITALLVAQVAEATDETVDDVIVFLVNEIYPVRERSTAVLRSLSAILAKAREQPIYDAIAVVVQRGPAAVRRWEEKILGDKGKDPTSTPREPEKSSYLLGPPPG